MARLWSSGFELNANTGGIEYDTNGGALSTIVTSPVRSGTYANNHKRTTNGNGACSHVFVSPATTNTIYSRFYFNLTTAPAADAPIFRILGTGGTTTRCSIWLTTASKLQLKDAAVGSQIGSDSAALSTGTWYRIELQANPGAGTATLLLDGVQVATGTPTAVTNLNTIGWGNFQTSTTFEFNFDDIAVNDDQGSFQTSYPGAGSIVHLKPNGNGDNSGWLGNDLDSTDNYLLVDEITPDDATTSVGGGIQDLIDDYNIENAPAAIGATDTITCVQVGVRFNAALAGSDASFVVRIKASSGGTVEESGNIAPTTTTWTTNAPAAPKIHPLTLYDLPGASTTVWTKADLNTAQIGERVSITGTNADQVTVIWLLVEYTPAAAAITQANSIGYRGQMGVGY